MTHGYIVRMNNETETEVTDELYDMLGYDSKSKKVRMGMLAEKTHPYIKQKVVEMLMSQCNFSQWEAEEVMNKTWKDTPEDLQIKMTGNLSSLFKQLKEKGKFKFLINLASNIMNKEACVLHQ